MANEEPIPVVPPVAPPVAPVPPAPTAPAPTAPLLSTVDPGAVYAPTNIQSIDIPSAKKVMDMKLSKVEDKLAKANSIAELNQIGIINQPKAMGVLTGEAAYRQKLDTARINAFNSLYNNKIQEMNRKEAERQQFIQTYGADPHQRPKGMSAREFAKAITAGGFSNLLTTEAKLKNAQLKAAQVTAGGGSGTWSQQVDPATGEGYLLNSKTAERKPLTPETAGLALPAVDKAIEAQILKNVGPVDGFANPTDYEAAKAEYLKKAPDQAIGAKTFDQVYGVHLNPVDATRMGVSQGAGSVKGVPPVFAEFASTLTPQGQLAFAGLSAIDQSNVQQLVNGDILLSDLVATRGAAGTAQRQRLLAAAQAVDPTFSENTNKIRFAFNQKWSSTESSIGKNRTAINTAIGHLADVAEAAKALQPDTINKMNSVSNVLNKEIKGDPAVTNFRLAVNALAGELASVYKNGTAPTDQETEEWRNAIADNFAQSQYTGVFDTAAKLLTSKITAVRYQYKLTMGKEFADTVIDPDKRQQLLDAGIDPEVVAKENVGGLQVIDPNGGIHNFPTKQAADAFKKAIGQ